MAMRSPAVWGMVGLFALVGCKSGGGQATTPGDGGTDRPSDSAGAPDGLAGPDAPAGIDAPTDGGSDVSDVSRATAVCRAAIETQCRRQATCRGGGTDITSCAAVGDRCPDYYFNSRSTRTVAEIEACLPAFAQMTCTDVHMNATPACLRWGTGAAGSPCLYNTECEFTCADGLDGCGTCYASTWAATGGACDATHTCATTDYCHSATRTCEPKASIVHVAEGQPCDFAARPSVGCQGDLVCARTTSTGTAGICRPIPQLGEPCVMPGATAGTQQLCASGLQCDAQSTCQPRPPPATGCGDGGVCDDPSFCRVTSTTSTCVPRAAEGELCRRVTTAEGPVIECAIGIWCVIPPGGTINSNGTCTRPGTIGDTCDGTHPCTSSLCGVEGRCTAFDPAACQP